MFPRRFSTPAPSRSPFDHLTVATFVVTAAVAVGTVIGYGPAKAVAHVGEVLEVLPESFSSDVDPDVAARGMYFGLHACPMSPLCPLR